MIVRASWPKILRQSIIVLSVVEIRPRCTSWSSISWRVYATFHGRLIVESSGELLEISDVIPMRAIWLAIGSGMWAQRATWPDLKKTNRRLIRCWVFEMTSYHDTILGDLPRYFEKPTPQTKAIEEKSFGWRRSRKDRRITAFNRLHGYLRSEDEF